MVQKHKRLRHPMPRFISQALEEHNLREAYATRPPYQRNDYIGWITRAKRDSTRLKRLNQMIRELRGGNRYMNMNYNSKIKS